MTDPGSADLVILKIFSGVQVGVEVTLASGEYRIGSGPDDDIQLIDVSLKPGHARLRVSSGKIELGGGTGSVTSATGTVIEPDAAWREIEPLDLVTAGTTRFALGYPTSRWESIAEAETDQPQRPAESPSARAIGLSTLWTMARPLAVPAAALLVLIVGATWFLAGGGMQKAADPAGSRIRDLAKVRDTLDGFPFGRPIDAHQEVDGTIYVNGYVETPVERRALVGALEATAVPARVRLWVLQTLRAELASLIESQRVKVTAELAPDGVAVLEGTILSEPRATRFVDLVRDRVLGLSDVQSRIRTVTTLLADVEKLAVTTQIQPWIILRADGELIEASGAIPVSKVDAWVGFLQSYARRFSRDVALRSFVQLQNPAARNGPQSSRAIVVGAQPSDGDAALNLERLRQGSFQLDEVFAGATPSTIAEAQRQIGDDGPAPDPLDRSSGAPRRGDGASDRDSGSALGPNATRGALAVRDAPDQASPLGAARARDPAPAGSDGDLAAGGATTPRGATAYRDTPDQEPQLRLSQNDPSTGPAPPEAAPGRAGSGVSTGPGGAAGPGSTGPAGRPGLAGTPGRRGSPGASGVAVAPGSPGGSSAPGSPGAAGAPGVAGAPGMAGSASSPGAAGGPASSGRSGGSSSGGGDAADRGLDPATASAASRGADLQSARTPSSQVGPDGRSAAGGRPSAAPEAGATARASNAPPDRQEGLRDLTSAAPTPTEAAGDDLAQQGRDVLERWKAGSLGTDARGSALRIAIETLRIGAGTRLGSPDSRELPPWYVPVLNGPKRDSGPACWPTAQLRASNIPASLFWLDILSATEGVTLATFKRDVQALLLEAALNPTRLTTCAAGSVGSREAAANSLYLREIRRNPSFVRFITRDLPPFALDITGANLADERFLLTRTGRKMYEGMAPDRSSRLALIGELGVAIQLSRGLAAVVYDPEMPWKISQ